jgi:hypothetical protein
MRDFKSSMLVIIAVFASALMVGACGRSVTSRYKLTLSVETPEGVKNAFSVVETTLEPGEIGVHGEALYLDLGPGRRPLIALLTAKQTNKKNSTKSRRTTWSNDNGPMTDFVLRLYGDSGSAASTSRDKFFEDEQRKARLRGPRPISPDDLPDLVTFADVNVPKSVILVDPNNLEATFGAGVRWKSITLEITDARLTTGIESRLTWLSSYSNKVLSGKEGGELSDGSLADSLDTSALKF